MFAAGSVGNQGEDHVGLGPKGQARTHDSSSRCGDHPHAEGGGGICPQASCRKGSRVVKLDISFDIIFLLSVKSHLYCISEFFNLVHDFHPTI
jgi:hypothetical protein